MWLASLQGEKGGRDNKKKFEEFKRRRCWSEQIQGKVRGPLSWFSYQSAAKRIISGV